jgi:hypothetical protein
MLRTYQRRALHLISSLYSPLRALPFALDLAAAAAELFPCIRGQNVHRSRLYNRRDTRRANGLCYFRPSVRMASTVRPGSGRHLAPCARTRSRAGSSVVFPGQDQGPKPAAASPLRYPWRGSCNSVVNLTHVFALGPLIAISSARFVRQPGFAPADNRGP